MSDRAGNIKLMIYALVIAICLSVFVNLGSQPNKQREFEVALKVRNLPENLIVTYIADRVKIVAEGDSKNLDRLDTGSIGAYVDLANAKPGQKDYVAQASAPFGVSVTLTVKDSRQRISLERLRHTDHKVDLVYSGTPAAGYSVTAASILPEKVSVSAPDSLMANVKSVRALLELGKVRPGGSYEVRVEVLGDGNKPVPLTSANPSVVTVSPAVTATATSKRALVAPIFVGQPSFGYRVSDYEVKPQQVEVEGDSGLLAKLSTLESEPIDLKGLKADLTTEVKLIVPQGIRVMGSLNATVTIHVVRTARSGRGRQ